MALSGVEKVHALTSLCMEVNKAWHGASVPCYNVYMLLVDKLATLLSSALRR